MHQIVSFLYSGFGFLSFLLLEDEDCLLLEGFSFFLICFLLELVFELEAAESFVDVAFAEWLNEVGL